MSTIILLPIIVLLYSFIRAILVLYSFRVRTTFNPSHLNRSLFHTHFGGSWKTLAISQQTNKTVQIFAFHVVISRRRIIHISRARDWRENAKWQKKERIDHENKTKGVARVRIKMKSKDSPTFPSSWIAANCGCVVAWTLDEYRTE